MAWCLAAIASASEALSPSEVMTWARQHGATLTLSQVRSGLRRAFVGGLLSREDLRGVRAHTYLLSSAGERWLRWARARGLIVSRQRQTLETST